MKANSILSVRAFNTQFNTSIILNVDDGIICYRTKEEEEAIALIRGNDFYTLTVLTTNHSNILSNLYTDNSSEYENCSY